MTMRPVTEEHSGPQSLAERPLLAAIKQRRTHRVSDTTWHGVS
jgi:hypothetical protein